MAEGSLASGESTDHRPRLATGGATAAVGLLVGWMLLGTVTSLVTRALAPDIETRWLGLAALIPVAVTAAVILTVRGWWEPIGFRRGVRPGRWWVLLIPAIVVLAPWAGGFESTDVATLALLLIGYALTAFAEESVFRGMMLRLLRGRGVREAVLLSSLLFGIAHLANVVIRGNPAIVAAQAVGAFTSGVGYASVYVLTGTIWAPMGVHLMHDLVLNTGVLPVIAVDVLQDIVLVVYGVILLWFTRAGRESPNPAG